MTHSEQVAIAEAVRQLRTFEAHDAELSETVALAVRWSSVADALAKVLASTDAGFDRDGFMERCGLTPLPTLDRMKAAAEAIEREDDICFDVCAESGQIFGNVRETRWFHEAVADALEL